MNTAILEPPRSSGSTIPRRRSLAALLAPLDRMAAASGSLLKRSAGRFEADGEDYELPRYVFHGPAGGGDPLRIGIFAAIHGDEPEGAAGLISFVQQLVRNPAIAQGYVLFLYPVCNPTGYEDGTRSSRRGHDLNREFWNTTHEPEVLLLQDELCTHAFHGLIALHSDDTSHGLYGFVSGATLTKNLLEPALKASEQFLPRNDDAVIDGFNARNGIIRQGYRGILKAPPKVHPRPFEIVFETPQHAPQFLQEKALVVALHSILTEYRKVISYAANI